MKAIRFLCAIFTLTATLQVPAISAHADDKEVAYKAAQFDGKVRRIGALTNELQELTYQKALLVKYIESSDRKADLKDKVLTATSHTAQMGLSAVAAIALNTFSKRITKSPTTLRRATVGLVALLGSWTGFGYSVVNGFRLASDVKDINNMREFAKMSDEEIVQLNAALDAKAAAVSAEREALRQEVLR